MGTRIHRWAQSPQDFPPFLPQAGRKPTLTPWRKQIRPTRDMGQAFQELADVNPRELQEQHLEHANKQDQRTQRRRLPPAGSP